MWAKLACRQVGISVLNPFISFLSDNKKYATISINQLKNYYYFKFYIGKGALF